MYINVSGFAFLRGQRKGERGRFPQGGERMTIKSSDV